MIVILDNLILLAGFILEELIFMLGSPTGFIASFSLIIFFEYILTGNIIKDFRKAELNKSK